MTDGVVYKILLDQEFAALQAGDFAGSAADIADGFVHLSTAAQLTATADKHFAGQEGLIVAAVELTRLGDAVQWEISRGAEKFPHLYGRLMIDAVMASGPLERAADGTVRLPSPTS